MNATKREATAVIDKRAVDAAGLQAYLDEISE